MKISSDKMPRKEPVLWHLVSLATSVLYALFLYAANSPLGPSYSNDNSIYMVMGTALARGFRPYLDIFDHKGPLLFLLQWLPQSFGDGYVTFPIFIQEVLFLFLCLQVIRRICKRHLNCSPIIPCLLYLAFTCSLVGEGNLSEEYSNLFTLIALSVLLEFYDQDAFLSLSDQEIRKAAAVIGVMFLLGFLMRANNGLPVACMVLGTALYLLFTRRFRIFAACLSGFLIGALCVFLPIAVWLVANGAFGASIQASILHNLLYSETASEYALSRGKELLYTDYGHTALFFALLSGCASILVLIKKHSPGLSLSLLLATGGAIIAAFISHKYYDHYLMLGIPVAAIAGGLLFAEIPQRFHRAACVLILFPCLCWLGYQCRLANLRRVEETANQAQFFEDARALADLIPTEDQDSVYPYRVESRWFVASRLLPCNRYYFLQEVLAEANPAVMDEIVSFFEETPPAYVVIFREGRLFSPPFDSRVQHIFDTWYETISVAGDYRLLRLL